jgi:hypothetical protein
MASLLTLAASADCGAAETRQQGELEGASL